jgi:hypothetical protein
MSSLLLFARSLCFRVVWVFLVRLVVADSAASRSAQLAMSGHVASDAADNGPLYAAFRVRVSNRS